MPPDTNAYHYLRFWVILSQKTGLSVFGDKTSPDSRFKNRVSYLGEVLIRVKTWSSFFATRQDPFESHKLCLVCKHSRREEWHLTWFKFAHEIALGCLLGWLINMMT